MLITIKNKALFKIFITFTLLLLSLHNAYAGMFSVTPVRIYMTPKDRAVAVTVTNDSDEPLVMQADLYLWKQKLNGEDELSLTEDMFLSPPILKLAANSRQVVRLARLAPSKSTEQLSYRLIVREIPEARPAKENLQLQIALAFSMPVFITPPDAKPQLKCNLKNTNSLVVTCENTGNAHVHPTQISLLANDGTLMGSEETGAYLLPGTKHDFLLMSSELVKSRQDGTRTLKLNPGKAKLSVTLDDTSKLEFVVNIP